MAITALTPGAIAASTGADVVVPLPASMQTNDIILIHVYVRNTGNTTTITDYTEIAQLDTANADHRWFWKRHDGSESNPTAANSVATDTYARAYAFRGCITTGSPFDVVGTPSEFAASPMSVTGITTTVAGAMVAVMDGYADNNLASAVTTATDPATFTDVYAEDASGADGSVHMGYAVRTTAGATGTITVTYNGSFTGGDQSGCLVVALKPPVVAPSATGTVTLPAATVSGTGDLGMSGSGAVTLTSSTVSSTGTTGTPYLVKQWQLVQLIAH